MTEDTTSLNKYISQSGICSRRDADLFIEAGMVTINGKVAQKGNRVKAGDKVIVNGKKIKAQSRPVYLLLNKPIGVTSTTELKDPTNIISFVNYKQRIFPIGRLDKDSSGLIILTNDGDIVNKILRVENNHEKEYIVSVDKPITPEFIKKMSNGLPILGTRTKRCRVDHLSRNVFRIVLKQGLNRQIRRMCAVLNYKVTALKRVRIMHIKVTNLRPGQWRYLSEIELEKLFKQLQG